MAHFNDVQSRYEAEYAAELKKYEPLKDLDVFVLDNSIRESTVAMLRGHTIDDKWNIYKEVQNLGFKNMIIASLSSNTRVDDLFIKELVEKGEDLSGLWAFSEITAATKDQVPDTEKVPIALSKMKELGLQNPILEVDLGDAVYNFDKISVDDICKLVKKWLVWSHENLHINTKVFINLRDPPDVFPTQSTRVFQFVDFLAKLPKNLRPFGLLFEEPAGKCIPEEIYLWSKYIREAMERGNWKGHLLVHVHEKFGFAEFTQLKALANGCDGLWASVCSEGAAMGHACSTTTFLNLIRLGNKKILKKYNCKYLRDAAVNVTKITTGIQPHPKHIIYGDRALDYVFTLDRDPDFDMAEFFGEDRIVRMSTLTPVPFIQLRLKNVFGDDEQFTEEIAARMKDTMCEDLSKNRKEEYMSPAGLAVLFDRAGGQLTEKMGVVIAEMKSRSPHSARLLKEIREIWDEWDSKEKSKNDDMLEFDSFYHAFLQPYFSCYRCSDTKKALQAIDMDSDGQIDWNELLVYLNWAMNQYPGITTVEQLMDCAVRKGIIPAMRDEQIPK